MESSQNCSKPPFRNRGTYLEIYKLQIDAITKISDRRVNVSRYYIFAISALILALSVVSSSDFLEVFRSPIIGTAESAESSKDTSEKTQSILLVTGIVGLLGSVLTFSWVLNMRGYLISSTKRYKKVADLESRLPYQFTKSIWQPTSNGKNKQYLNFAFHELITPFVFFFVFTMLSVYAFCEFFVVDSRRQLGIFLIACGVVVILWFVMYIRSRANVE